MTLLIETAAALLALFCVAAVVHAQASRSADVGNGFTDHGVATPISHHRGTVATVDGEGRPVVLAWLMDHRGGYGLLVVDATDGRARLHDTGLRDDSPFAAVLSSANRYYTHFASTFLEFDPAAQAFSFRQATAAGMAMSMTEADDGTIWSATYPNSGVTSYSPRTGAFRDYGHVYAQTWPQYPRAIAVDEAGWVYFGVGNTAAQILILDPQTGQATPVLAEEERGHGMAQVYRDQDGRCYASTPAGQWYQLHAGRATKIAEPAQRRPKPIVEGSQGLFHRTFPTGQRLDALDLVEGRLTVTDAAGQTRVLPFEYPSEGAHLMGLAASSDHTICGGTAFPMRFFAYDPRTDRWTNRPAYGQYNTVAGTAGPFYMGGYTGGWILEWDPARQWVDTDRDNPQSNPRFLAQADPTINRPHGLLVHPDGRYVVLAGTPGYGLTGGGLLVWDRREQAARVLTHEELLPWHSPMSLAPLPEGRLLVGTTVAAGTGGQVRAEEAQLLIVHLGSGRVEWHAPVLAAVRDYGHLVPAPDGRVFGIADRARFFVFDPATRQVVHEEDVVARYGRTCWQQGPRVFVTSPDGRYFVLFEKGIAELDPRTWRIEMLAESPVPIGPGGDWLDGRIYFGHGSHLYSWRVPGAP
ncbi:MAG: hypothetical protein AB1505_13255 [Candidatus Latescibacterota bacterium]